MPSESEGFLSSCDIHYLYRDATANLPIAFNSCTNDFSGNFDLDNTTSGYHGSNFRADKSGWVRADFKMCCGDVQQAPGKLKIKEYDCLGNNYSLALSVLCSLF